MQAQNAQGIMGLMSQGRAPQQPQPMPSPMKASPMAGLGSVEDRVAAYRGNPAPLQQRYQMSQDLLDLLALQKIKSEKDAAARQMQLQMSQQQAAQGMEPQTVAQQREKEVMEMTKNELAQQRGETAQHQQEQQQDAMKRAMSGGIAAAPGAASAAQPKAMATGGIVAFAEGGTPLDAARERRRAAQEALYRFGLRQRQQNPEGFRAAQAELDAADAALQDAERAESGGPAGVMRRSMGAPAAPTPPAPPVSAAYPDETQRGSAAGLTAAPAAPRVPPPAAPTVSGIATPRPAAPAGTAAPAAPAAPAPGAPADGLASLVDKTATNMMNIDPEARQKAMEERVRAAYALTPEQRAVYEQGTAQRQKMFDETYNPERQREQGLIKYLLGAGGRRYGEFAGGAEAGMSYDEAQRQNKIKDFEALQKGREGLIGLEREGIKPSIEGGLAALKEYATGQRAGVEAGYKRVEGALDRESKERIARDSNRIQGMIAQATRDQTLEIRRQGFLGDINKLETNSLNDVRKGPVAKAAAGLEQLKAMNPKGFTKEQQQQLDDLNRQIQDAEDAVRAQMDVYRQQVGGFTGKPGGGGGGGSWGQLNVVPGKK